MPDNDRRLSRRRFLRGAGAATLAALLAACRLSAERTELPTPGQPGRTASPRPTFTDTPTATAFRSPLATPTPDLAPDTPQPTEAAPPPTATPTPLPTPFPPGPATKLGVCVEWFNPQIMDLVATGNVALLKTMELDPAFLADVRARSPRTIIVGRVNLDELHLDRAEPAAAARRAVDAVLPLALDERRRGLVDAWEGYNEPVAGSEDELRLLSDVEAERVRLLAGNGLRAVVGNFGTGQPPLEWWPAFRPALEAALANDGYLGLHEYSAPTLWFNTNREPLDFRAEPGDEGWLTLRYRKVYRQILLPWGLRLPLLITECGIDGLVHDRPGPAGKGWKDFAGHWNELGMGLDAPGNYVEQLAWYDRQLQHDDYCLGASIFTLTGFQDWQSYELLGEPAAILQQYLSVHPLR